MNLAFEFALGSFFFVVGALSAVSYCAFCLASKYDDETEKIYANEMRRQKDTGASVAPD